MVFHLQVYGVFRHAVLHSTQEEQPGVDVARYPPWMHAVLGVDGHEIRSRYKKCNQIYNHAIVL